MEIREATHDDVLDFLILSRKFLKESKYPFSLDKELLEDNFYKAILDPSFLVVVAEDKGDVVGILVGGITSPLFSRDTVATELAWFIEPDYRDTKNALKLFKHYEDWAKKSKCKFITMMDIHQLQDLGPLYTRKGYTLTEKTYVKEL